MKKILAMVLAVLMALSAMGAVAEDLGIQVIGGGDTAMETVSLDDMQIGTEYTIDGYAKVLPQSYLVVDQFAQFNKDANYENIGTGWIEAKSTTVYIDNPANDWNYNWRYNEASWMESGVNAEFVWFLLDITNLQKNAVNFIPEMTVKIVYQDEYEFAGWVRQINYDYTTKEVSRYNVETAVAPSVVLDPANEEAQEMLYTGTYVVGCTLPNSVVEDAKSALRIEITMGENDLTYHISK